MKIENEKLIMNLQLFGEGELEIDDNFDIFEDELPIDDTDIPTDDTIDDPENEEVVNDGEVEEVQQEIEPFLTIKYNKEDKPLTMEEAIALSQKGMNYDKVMEKLYQAENNPVLNYLSDIAARNNTTPEELVNYWKQQEEQAQLDQLVQQNIPEEYAREMLESRKFREQMQQQQQAEIEREKQNNEFKDFVEAFPNVDPKSIPKDVWEKNSNGIPLKYAYMEWNMSNVINENKVLKQQSNNSRIPATGTAKFGNKDNMTSDDFLDGFNSYSY